MTITALDGPHRQDLEVFRNWMEYPHQGNFPLRGPDRFSWDPDHTSDLMALVPARSADVFTRWLLEKLVPTTTKNFTLLLRKLGRTSGSKSTTKKSAADIQPRVKGTSQDPESGIHTYKITRVNYLLDIIVTVIASMFPVLSIIVLFYIRASNVRLGLIAAFTTLFALALATLTQCGRQEVFAACAA